jgi:hypothetical protein
MPKRFRTAVVEKPSRRKWVVHVDDLEPHEFDDRETATEFAQQIGWDPEGRKALDPGAGTREIEESESA